MKDVQTIINKYYQDYSKIRREIHMHPELGMQEYKTQKIIIETLNKLSIENHKLFETGVVGLIKGKYPGKTILLRADMDALEIDELANVDYKSKISGIMHACGHDGHVAGLLGAAMVLNNLKDELHGNVKLMFQPAEEKDGGAKQMIELGILENPKVDAAVGIHLESLANRGQVITKIGAMMSATDRFKIKIVGRGGHAATPHLSVDPIVIGANVITLMQNIRSRYINTLYPAVLSITKFHGGDIFNVIPNTIEIEGTIRAFDQNVINEMQIAMDKILQGQALATDCTYEFEYIKEFPAVINNKELTELANNSISKIINKEDLIKLEEPKMGGEDFSYLGEKVPSTFIYVGISETGKPKPIAHNPYFEWNDESLKTSVAVFTQIVLDYLK
ncbi:M20 metallopeptidase family protein [Mycoplasma sp. P36-A1]|uniref:M20 metallopeptidase family protein n=1 Tax=Mycoplasma sp. P36-A1 TaxID=3252900 RepID=UPI003C2C6731